MGMKYSAILLFGAPGSGKGTQGKIVAQQPGYYHFACGDVFRSLDPKSEMGLIFAKYANFGSLVPDEFTVKLWHQTVEQYAQQGKFNPQTQTLLLDGIPRTLEQAVLMRDRIDVLGVIYLVCNDVQEVIRRLQKRAQSSGRADDTDEEVIHHRLDVYEEQTQPVLKLYPSNRIARINATQAMEKVTADILSAIATFQQRATAR